MQSLSSLMQGAPLAAELVNKYQATAEPKPRKRRRKSGGDNESSRERKLRAEPLKGLPKRLQIRLELVGLSTPELIREAINADGHRALRSRVWRLQRSDDSLIRLWLRDREREVADAARKREQGE